MKNQIVNNVSIIINLILFSYGIILIIILSTAQYNYNLTKIIIILNIFIVIIYSINIWISKKQKYNTVFLLIDGYLYGYIVINFIYSNDFSRKIISIVSALSFLLLVLQFIFILIKQYRNKSKSAILEK